VGVPGRVVKRNNMHFPQEELDQTHLPDPVLEELSYLELCNDRLSQRLKELEEELQNMERNTQ
jgi:serine O-acetyltransferase